MPDTPDQDPSKAATESKPYPAWAKLHLWQMQPVRDVLLGLGILGLLYLGQKISVVTVPLLLAILLAYLFEPVIAWLIRKTPLTRRGAVATIIGGVAVLVVLPLTLGTAFGAAQLVGFGGRTIDNVGTVRDALSAPSEDAADLVFNEWAVRNEAESFSPTWRWIYEEINRAQEDDSTVGEALDKASAWIVENQDRVAETAAGVGINVVNTAVSFTGALFGLAFMGFITAFFFFFLATEWVKVKHFGAGLLPDKNRDRVIDLLQKFDAVISGFIRGRLTIAFFQAIVFSIGYFLIGVPGAFILGPIVAVLSIVPYLALVGVPISISLLWLEGHTGIRGAWWWVIGAPLAVYFIGQALDDYVLTPLIQGKSTGMDTPTILFASLAGGALFGVFGLLIAIPIAACLKILIQEIFWPRFKAWAEGRADDPLPIED